MKTVLHLIKEYRGNYPLLNEYVRSLPRENYQSIVCYLSGHPDGKNGLEAIASEVRYLELKNRSLKLLNPSVVLTVAQLMKSIKTDIVHCHRHKATVIGTLAAMLSGTRHVISHVHGLSRTRTKKRYLANWILFKKVEKIIAVSDSVKQDILDSNRNIPPAKVVTVRNGLDLTVIDSIHFNRNDARSRLGIPESNFVFGTVGRLTATKGQTYLIDAFADVVKHIPTARLVIVGEGPLLKELREKASRLGISEWTIFVGFRKDVLELLRGFDVFVLPSIAEGLSIALLEAMASRLPVIASRVGGIPEVVDKNCGILLPPGNSASLAEAMKTMISDEEKRTIAGNAARKRIQEAFTTVIMSRNMDNLYQSLST